MSGGGYLFAKTLIEVPAMLLLSVMALSAGIYGIGNFHGASYVLHVLLYTAVMWSLECMAQLFAVQFDNPLTGMLMYSALLLCVCRCQSRCTTDPPPTHTTHTTVHALTPRPPPPTTTPPRPLAPLAPPQ